MTVVTYFIIFFVQLFDVSTGYVNLAVHKPAWQTTNYSNTCCFASAVVDGNTSRNYKHNSCAIIRETTESGEWRVDLGKVLSIYNIRIYYRNDGDVNTWRMAGFFLFVSNTTNKEDGHLCFHEIQTSLPPNPMTITCIQHARYVIYYNERNRPGFTYPSSFSTSLWNELCEVQVYGCNETGFYGVDCDKPCPGNCEHPLCGIVNGHCFSCITGYEGPSCDQICRSNFYGQNCESECGQCLNGSTCHHAHGTCTNGCEEGWNGLKCDEVCTPGTYGLGCNQTCNNCYSNNTYTCHHVNGKCNNGCQPGWQGPYCDMVCGDHFYGANCALGCGKCLNRQKCNHINGTCLNGCEAGWEGDRCYSECTRGTFGLGCGHTCSTKCYGDTNDLCHPETGNCNNGCLPGWQGDHCEKTCDNFFYGENCAFPCGRCFGGEKCEHVDGICQNGCVAGLQGDLCNKVCDPGNYGQGCNQSCSENCNGTYNTCDHATGECIYGCKTGWKGEKCDIDALTDESVEQPQDMSQSNTLMTWVIVGWVFSGVLIVSIIIILILYKQRKTDPPKADGQAYADFNMESCDDSHVYSSVN